MTNIPGMLVLGSLGKHLNKPWGASKKAATLHGHCFSFCLQVPVLNTFDNENWYGIVSQISAFLPQLAFCLVFHHRNRNPDYKKGISVHLCACVHYFDGQRAVNLGCPFSAADCLFSELWYLICSTAKHAEQADEIMSINLGQFAPNICQGLDTRICLHTGYFYLSSEAQTQVPVVMWQAFHQAIFPHPPFI